MFYMPNSINPVLSTNASTLSKEKAIGRLRSDMKAAGFDIGQGTLQRILAGETGVRMESLQKFADYFGVDLETRLRGQVTEEFVSVPHLSVEVGAGPGRANAVVENIGSLQFRRDFLRAAGVSPTHAAVVSVVGASMEPTFGDGAVLLLNTADKEPRPGRIYAFELDGEMLVKRFQKVDGLWHAVSDNADKEDHPDIVINGHNHPAIQGRAIWMGSKL